jgi:threonine/homoserine/homoserine lactone efflux protein
MNMRATFHLLGITDVWFCTVCYGCMLVMVGNAAAKRLKNNRRIASFASRAAGAFLVGFGIKLTTN